MRSALRGLMIALLLAPVPVWAHGDVKRWPHEGRLWYNGADYAQIDFAWHEMGGWKGPDQAFELDIQMPSNFFTGCTAWSNMSNFYSDCGTAGWTEWTDTNNLGVGTYYAPNNKEWTFYQARYTLTGAQGFNTGGKQVNLQWQEAYRHFCPEYSPACMNGWTQNPPNGGILHYGIPWQRGQVAVSSWDTPYTGMAAPENYEYDIYDPCGLPC